MIENDEIDLIALWKIVWSAKVHLISITLLFAILSVLFALYLPNIYRADTTLFPVEGYSQSTGGGLGGGLKDIASLAGVNVGSNESPKTVLALELLESRKFIIEFINNHKIKPTLMALEKWDKETGSETYNEEIYNIETKKWLVDQDTKLSLEPTDLKTYDIFKNSLMITPDVDSSVVKVSLDFISPVRSKEWLDLLIKDLNAKVRNDDIEIADKSIKFLEQKLEETQVADIRRIFFSLIEEQMRKKLLAETMEEYVFNTIDPPVVSEKNVSPKRALICILGTFLGGLIGLIYIFIRYLFVRESR
ncbi:MAG: hypothetical protein H6912_08880 [Kordiimonadaceae bacterium]|nr:hypothetical protein [Kordiimonadaceae bacterium]